MQSLRDFMLNKGLATVNMTTKDYNMFRQLAEYKVHDFSLHLLDLCT